MNRTTRYRRRRRISRHAQKSELRSGSPDRIGGSRRPGTGWRCSPEVYFAGFSPTGGVGQSKVVYTADLVSRRGACPISLSQKYFRRSGLPGSATARPRTAGSTVPNGGWDAVPDLRISNTGTPPAASNAKPLVFASTDSTRMEKW